MTVSTEISNTNLDGIVALEKEIFRECWSRESYLSSMKSGNLVSAVLEEDGTVIAFASFIHICNEGDINNIAVNPEYRGKGFGKRIMLELIGKAKSRSITDLTLEVRTSNTVAIKLYESLGFCVEGIRKHFYHDGEDALIMWKHGI